MISCGKLSCDCMIRPCRNPSTKNRRRKVMDLWRLSGCEEQNLEKETFFNLVSTSPPPIFKLNRITKYTLFFFFWKAFLNLQCNAKCCAAQGRFPLKWSWVKKKLFTRKVFEFLDINVGMGRSDAWHVDTIKHHGDDVIGQDLPELLCDVIPA